MQHALKDKTNTKQNARKGATAGSFTEQGSLTSNCNLSEKASEKDDIISFLKSKLTGTRDPNLAYDLHKCVEILEGKENSEFCQLKEYYEALAIEKEALFRENCELQCELDYLKNAHDNVEIIDDSE